MNQQPRVFKAEELAVGVVIALATYVVGLDVMWRALLCALVLSAIDLIKAATLWLRVACVKSAQGATNGDQQAQQVST